jgi:dTDP-glucose 4,6-dehydratase
VRYFVTGCAGFIGSEFVAQLLSDENTEMVIGFDALTYAGKTSNMRDFAKHSRFKFVRGDIADPKHLEEVMPENAIIINFAAESHVDRSIDNPSIFLQTNIVGVGNLLEVSLKKSVLKFVQISTDEVLGSIAEGSWKSSDPLLPNSPYSASKASAELLVRSYGKTYGISYLITRSSNNYGPRQATEKLIPKLITSMLQDLPLTIYGNGMNIREWMHVSDNAKVLLKLLWSGAEGIWNIPGGHERNNCEIVEILRRLIPESKSETIFVQDRLGHDLRYSMDPSEYQSKYGDLEQLSLEAGLHNTIAWYRTNKELW